MEAKLIKRNGSFYLMLCEPTNLPSYKGFNSIDGSVNEDLYIIATSWKEAYSKAFKLSKQNCDEIFGVVDVEKLATQHLIDKNCASLHTSWQGYNENTYKEGFNKAMELNKDKVFTLEDMRYFAGFAIGYTKHGIEKDTEQVLEDKLKSLQQPTEIEVEIEMEEIQEIHLDGVLIPGPKLDSKGCLILKKI